MAEIYVENYEPLDGETALEIASAYKQIGHRVEIYTTITDKIKSGEFFSLKILIVEPVDAPHMKRMLEIAESFGRPVRFNETEGFRVG